MTNAVDKKIFGKGFFGTSLKPEDKGALSKNFIIPPFSILDTCQGQWRTRKDAWISLGLVGEEGRREDTTSDETGIAYRKTLNGFGGGLRKAYKLKELGIQDSKDYDYDAEEATGVSVFDPVLCELAYRWFSKPGWTVLDPFAGGSTRGIVAAMTSREYIGIEVRENQVKANSGQADVILGQNHEGYPWPTWILGDSSKLNSIVDKKYGKGMQFDLCFSCPPYYDLEVYSSDSKDGSTHKTYKEFITWYKDIYKQAIEHLADNRFLVIVVGEIRDKKTGEYRNLVGDTIQVMKDLGLHYWNEMIIVNSRGSASLRTNRPFKQTRKVTKVHQNMVVFYKGSLDSMRETFEVIDGEI